MSPSLKQQVDNAEALVKTRLHELHEQLKDQNLPKSQRDRILATVQQLEEGLQAETVHARKKCGVENNTKKT